MGCMGGRESSAEEQTRDRLEAMEHDVYICISYMYAVVVMMKLLEHVYPDHDDHSGTPWGGSQRRKEGKQRKVHSSSRDMMI